MLPDVVAGLTPPSGEAEKSETKPRGRPKGAKGRRSADLAKYIAGETNGLMPGHQLVRLASVTPRDIREAKKWAQDKGWTGTAPGSINYKMVDPVILALSHRAEIMAQMNKGWTSHDAWSIIMAAKKELMSYVHQKQGSVEPIVADKRAVIHVKDTKLGAQGNPSQGADKQREISFGPLPLTHTGSHTDAKA